jgi:bacteriocin-like protein
MATTSKKSKVKVNSLKKENKTLSEKNMKKIKGGSAGTVKKKPTSVDGEGYGIGG